MLSDGVNEPNKFSISSLLRSIHTVHTVLLKLSMRVLCKYSLSGKIPFFSFGFKVPEASEFSSTTGNGRKGSVEGEERCDDWRSHCVCGVNSCHQFLLPTSE